MTILIQSTIQAQIQRELLINHGISTNDRRAALEVARSLQSQLFFYEVEWGGRALTDGVEDVYMFLDDQEGGSDARIEMEELPTGVVTYLTKCYTPCCVDGQPCYAYSCPRRVSMVLNSGDDTVCSGNFYCGIRDNLRPSCQHLPSKHRLRERYVSCAVRWLSWNDGSYSSLQSVEWQEGVPPEILASLPESEVKRQTYDARHWRNLSLNLRYLGSSARSSRKNSSTSKIWTSSKMYVTDQATYRVTVALTHLTPGFHSPSTKCKPSCHRGCARFH